MSSNPEKKFALPNLHGLELNEFQIWLLLQMGIEDSRFPPYSSGNWSITPKQISRVVPRTILPQINSMEYIWTSLIQLKDRGLIEWNRYNLRIEHIEYNPNSFTDPYSIDPHTEGSEVYWKHEDMNFHITSEGILIFRKYLEPLSSAIRKDTYETVVNKTEGPEPVKSAFKSFAIRIKDKIQDRVENQIIDGFIDLGKEHGAPAITLMVKLIVNSITNTAS